MEEESRSIKVDNSFSGRGTLRNIASSNLREERKTTFNMMIAFTMLRIGTIGTVRKSENKIDERSTLWSSLAISGECTTTLHIGPNISIWYENITREILGWVAKKPSVPPSQKDAWSLLSLYRRAVTEKM
ncbi:hypothetical protein PRIPAC_96323 [Pristionchus pacificus]|uniref:Uncharacterized protein n=1 Tax=Pristionchus pacificus TaxID=54126 RepID=A0A2A6D266_PRIPA|nr:hypothetical protein PRIPAC_96323 [Pristionchus pacificus]|eukprot:PDM84480.1 hypothetical protein PRIPAC_33503 [Pristionchus pacificus]